MKKHGEFQPFHYKYNEMSMTKLLVAHTVIDCTYDDRCIPPPTRYNTIKTFAY